MNFVIFLYPFEPDLQNIVMTPHVGVFSNPKPILIWLNFAGWSAEQVAALQRRLDGLLPSPRWIWRRGSSCHLLLPKYLFSVFTVFFVFP